MLKDNGLVGAIEGAVVTGRVGLRNEGFRAVHVIVGQRPGGADRRRRVAFRQIRNVSR